MVQKNGPKHIKAGFVLGWALGILFILFGLLDLQRSFFAGLFVILGAIIILPPFGDFIEKRYNYHLSGWSKIILLFMLVFIGMFISLIFSQPSGQFNQKVTEETKVELFMMRAFYGQCEPGETFENKFMSEFEAADSEEAKDAARSGFRDEIDRCKYFSDSKESCGLESGCVWR